MGHTKVFMKLATVLQACQYLSPLAVISFFSIAAFSTFLRQEKAKSTTFPQLKRVVCGGLGIHVLLCITQASLIIDLIFTKPGIYGSDAANIHALSDCLVWIVITTSLLVSDGAPWLPYCGSWLIALVFEILSLALSLAIRSPRNGLEAGSVAIGCLHILLFSFLTAVLFTCTSLHIQQKGPDEERTPLLIPSGADGQPTSYAACSADLSSGVSSSGREGNEGAEHEDSEASDDESDCEEDWLAERQKKQAQITQRMKEEGGWLAYLKSFSVFLPYVWPAHSFRLKLHLLGVIICMLVQRVLIPLEPRQLGILVDTLAKGKSGETISALGIYILLNAVSSNIGQLRSWLWLPVETSSGARLEKASYNHIMELSCDFHDSKRTGEVFEAMHQGRSIVNLLETIGFELVPEVADLVIACAYFYWLFDVYMVLVGLATGIIYACISAWTTSKSGNRRREMNQALIRKGQIRNDTISGWKTVSYFNRIAHSQERFAIALSLANRLYLANRRFWSYMYSFQSIIIDIGLFCACTLAVYQILYRGRPVGKFVTLMNYWGRLTGPLITLSHTSSNLIFDLIDAESLLRLWKKSPSVVDGSNEMSLNEGHVKFENVSFKYNTKKGALDKLTFEAKPGQTIALVGETGAGKSTILKLLFRFYDVSEGRIVIDGQDVRDVTLQSLRENIGVVPQDPALFNVSIIDNIRYARLDASDEEIYEACKAAAVHDKIMSFTKGYFSRVGERGVKLSGGELQRVAIARAILKNPPIVLLDEATSSVDSETEAKIQDGLKRLCYNRTTFVVAHRLSTIQHADQILVIKDGKIVETGTSNELIERKGNYYSLWTKQMGIFDSLTTNKSKCGAETDNSSDCACPVDSAPIKVVDAGDHKPVEEHRGQSTHRGGLNSLEDGSEVSGSGIRETGLRLLTDTDQVVTQNPDLSPSMSPSKLMSKFRPDAPEFVPKRQQVNVANGSSTEEGCNSSRPSSRDTQDSTSA